MYKLCKTEQSALRQRQLEEGLFAAMQEHPYEDISISDLCDRMGVPRKAFYRYFDSKEGALLAMLDHRLMDYETGASGMKQSEGISELKGFFEFWYEQKPFLDVLSRNGLTNLLIQRAITHSRQEQFLFIDPRNYSKGFSEYALIFTVTGLMNMIIRWHQEGFVHSPWEMAQISYRLLCKPLIPKADFR